MYNLCDVKKALETAIWSTITLNSEGKKFLAALENDQNKQNI